MFFILRYANDPRILLKIILFAYSRGITSSRKIAQCCEENIIFMALSAHTRPHFTTIADFISQQDEEATILFNKVILVCDAMGLMEEKCLQWMAASYLPMLQRNRAENDYLSKSTFSTDSLAKLKINYPMDS